MKIIIKICGVLGAIFIFHGIAIAEEIPSVSIGHMYEELSWQQAAPVEIQAKFRHSGANTEYHSYWRGIVNTVLTVDKNNNSVQLEFRTGIGKMPLGLSSSWNSIADSQSAATVAIPFCLTASEINESGLAKWMKVAEDAINPSLIIPLKSIPDKQGIFTNETTVKGCVFIRDVSLKKPRYRRYADITILPYMLELSFGHIVGKTMGFCASHSRYTGPGSICRLIV